MPDGHWRTTPLTRWDDGILHLTHIEFVLKLLSCSEARCAHGGGSCSGCALLPCSSLSSDGWCDSEPDSAYPRAVADAEIPAFIVGRPMVIPDQIEGVEGWLCAVEQKLIEPAAAFAIQADPEFPLSFVPKQKVGSNVQGRKDKLEFHAITAGTTARKSLAVQDCDVVRSGMCQVIRGVDTGRGGIFSRVETFAFFLHQVGFVAALSIPSERRAFGLSRSMD